MNIFKKKKRPVDVFGNIKKSHLEEAYVKFPGKKLKSVSKKRGAHYVKVNRPLINKLQKKYGEKYTNIHTHPNGGFLPTPEDLISFLGFEERRTSVIVPTRKTDGQPLGYFVIKKHGSHTTPNINENDFIKSMQSYKQSLSSDDLWDIPSNFKKLAKKYNFSYRFVSIGGTVLTGVARGFRSSRQSLETKLTIISFIFISLSILLSLSSITGNVISEFQFNMPDTINIGLFIAGLCFAGLIFLSKTILAKS